LNDTPCLIGLVHLPAITGSLQPAKELSTHSPRIQRPGN